MQPAQAWVHRALIAGLVGVVATGLITWLLLTIAHLRDGYRIGEPCGTWMALAQHLNRGQFYPPLFADGMYGGTRYMPLHIALLAGVARCTGEYLVAGKLIAWMSTAGLLTVVFALLKQRRCPTLMAMALTATILFAPTGLEAAAAIRGDSLALLFQLAGLWFIGRSDRFSHTAIAAIYCALAVLTKMSAIWVPGAIGLCLLLTNRRRLVLFTITYLICVVGSLYLLNHVTHGRLFENLFGLSASGIRGLWAIAWWSPPRLLGVMSEYAPACWALLPIVLLATFTAGLKRSMTMHHLALLCCGAVMWFLFADVGVAGNHLLDLLAITIVVTGDVFAKSEPLSPGFSGFDVRSLLAAIVIWVNLSGLERTIWPATREAWSALAHHQSKSASPYDLQRVVDRIGVNDVLLSEDPTIPVLMGRDPVMLDSFMLLRMERTHPQWIAALIERIKLGQFDKIVLSQPPDPNSWWYTQLAFGPNVATAIAEHYALAEQVGDHLIYKPTAR